MMRWVKALTLVLLCTAHTPPLVCTEQEVFDVGNGQTMTLEEMGNITVATIVGNDIALKKAKDLQNSDVLLLKKPDGTITTITVADYVKWCLDHGFSPTHHTENSRFLEAIVIGVGSFLGGVAASTVAVITAPVTITLGLTALLILKQQREQAEEEAARLKQREEAAREAAEKEKLAAANTGSGGPKDPKKPNNEKEKTQEEGFLTVQDNVEIRDTKARDPQNPNYEHYWKPGEVAEKHGLGKLGKTPNEVVDNIDKEILKARVEGKIPRSGQVEIKTVINDYPVGIRLYILKETVKDKCKYIVDLATFYVDKICYHIKKS